MKISNHRFDIRSTGLCVIIWLFIGLYPLSAQAPDSVKKWHVLTDIYLMFPNMDGRTGIADELTVPVDANPGDIFNKLHMAAMLYIEVQNNKWAFTSDMVYMNLNQEVTPGTIIHSGDVTVKQFIWEPAILYRVASFIEVGAGGRLISLAAETDVRRNVFPAGTEEYIADKSKTWFDPILITRLTADIKDKWLFQFRGDIGGFGAGSELTWQLQAYAGYRFTRFFQLTAGYRLLSIDYDKGAEKERFIYDVNTFGPVVRMGFNF
jgi:hypothetical protein